jgi:type IV pilus assembly protein PilP
MTVRVLFAVVILAAPAAVAHAQAPAPAVEQATAADAPPDAAPVAPIESYTYDPSGRRDPFLDLLNSGSEPRQPSGRPEGPASMMVGELSLRGVLQSKGELIAMIKGPDNKTYLVHRGDKLLDGTIKNITPQGLVILQEINDPLSLEKQREVRKMLGSVEDGKE